MPPFPTLTDYRSSDIYKSDPVRAEGFLRRMADKLAELQTEQGTRRGPLALTDYLVVSLATNVQTAQQLTLWALDYQANIERWKTGAAAAPPAPGRPPESV